MTEFHIGLFGAWTGMVGQEIERILLKHDQAVISYRQNSTKQEGDLSKCDVIFLATGDLESLSLAPQLLKAGKKVIDLSGAFRIPPERFERWYGIKHTAPELFELAVYGLPAYFKDRIANAQLVANPGCYPTATILALKPLEELVQGEAIIDATSGNSGARKQAEPISSEATYNHGKNHKHVPEMELYSGVPVIFTPTVLESVFRGINMNIKVELVPWLKKLPDEEAAKFLRARITNRYLSEDLVFVVEDSKEKRWGTRDVNHTHKAVIKLWVDSGRATICSMIDNLGKGAASQAIENMNIMLGLPRLHGIDATYVTSQGYSRR